MQFHHRGYESGDPRIRPSEGYGIERGSEVPEEVDVLIVGAGPAGVLLAAQLAQFPSLNVRVIEQRPGRLEIGRADGIQARSVETFQAFGFAEAIQSEAYQITETCFWKPDPNNPEHIIRASRTPDDPANISEFPHLIVNQARVLDYFIEAAARAPGRIRPDYGIEFIDLTVEPGNPYPVRARLRYSAGERQGEVFVVRAKYLAGADGARSEVRKAIGHKLHGDAAMHAWGVLDVLAESDFPDIRTKCAIQSHDGGNILLIPREGGYLFRAYVDLGETDEDDLGKVRSTSMEAIVERANKILHPYSFDVKSVGWWSVYEVAHRLTDGFDDVSAELSGKKMPRVFIMGDACHTHSAKAGQGMNVSMQDAFNLGWKLAAVLENRSPESLLESYSRERQVIAKDLIEFDKEWSTLMATPADQMDDPGELERFYVSGYEFSNGFKTRYPSSQIVDGMDYQHLAPGYPVGKRFKSAKVIRSSDANIVQLGHMHAADGRWRIYAFADASGPSARESELRSFGEWLGTHPDSPLVQYTKLEAERDAIFDVKVIYQQDYTKVEIGDVPAVFKPHKLPLRLTDTNKIFAGGVVDKQTADIFAERSIDPHGAAIVVRPDMYVAAVLPLSAREQMTRFFAQVMIPATR